MIGGFNVPNSEIKQAIRKHRLYQYEVATEAGISEYTLCVWLRHEMEPERKERVMEAIKRLSDRRAEP